MELGQFIVIAVVAGLIYFTYSTQPGGAGSTETDMLLLGESIILGSFLIAVLR